MEHYIRMTGSVVYSVRFLAEKELER